MGQRSNCRGFQQVTGLSTVVTLNVPASASNALIQAETQAVRWRDDGVAPTASVGMLLPAGGELRYDGNLMALKIIEVSPSAKLNVAFYG